MSYRRPSRSLKRFSDSDWVSFIPPLSEPCAPAYAAAGPSSSSRSTEGGRGKELTPIRPYGPGTEVGDAFGRGLNWDYA